MFPERHEHTSQILDGYVLIQSVFTRSANKKRDKSVDELSDCLAFKRSWILSMRWKPDMLRIITAQGDSMEPTIKDGVILLIDISQNRTTTEGIYVLKSNGQHLARRIQKMLDGKIKIKSDNPAYDDQIFTPKEMETIEVLGRVVWGGVRF